MKALDRGAESAEELRARSEDPREEAPQTLVADPLASHSAPPGSTGHDWSWPQSLRRAQRGAPTPCPHYCCLLQGSWVTPGSQPS